MLTAGVRPTFKVGRQTDRRVPAEYADAVELWAREHGGHATLKWLPDPMNCWVVRLSLRPGDPRAATSEPWENVYLHEWKTPEWWAKHKPGLLKRHQKTNRVRGASYAYELDELGVQGLRDFLDRGNLLSGRGEFRSAEAAGRAQVEKFRTEKHRRRRSMRDDAKHDALMKRRHLFKIPFIPVGIEFNKE